MCQLVAGGLPRNLSATRAAAELRRIRPDDAVGVERRRLAVELLGEVRRTDADLVELKARITASVANAATTVTDVVGVGPIMAAYLIGYTGDIRRFPSAGHYTRYNGTAPIEASSGPNQRHRLNPRGNRQLNHTLHIAAVTQVRNDTRGPRTTCANKPKARQRKRPMRALKRRISDAVYHQLLADTAPLKTGPGRQQGATVPSSVADQSPECRHFGKAIPGPNNNATPTSTTRTRTGSRTPT